MAGLRAGSRVPMGAGIQMAVRVMRMETSAAMSGLVGSRRMGEGREGGSRRMERRPMDRLAIERGMGGEERGGAGRRDSSKLSTV